MDTRKTTATQHNLRDDINARPALRRREIALPVSGLRMPGALLCEAAPRPLAN